MQEWGEATKGGEVAGNATLVCFSVSPVHLYSLFKLSPNHSLYPVGSWRRVYFVFHFSLSETKLQKHQLLHLQIYKLQGFVLISCTGKISMDV